MAAQLACVIALAIVIDTTTGGRIQTWILSLQLRVFTDPAFKMCALHLRVCDTIRTSFQPASPAIHIPNSKTLSIHETLILIKLQKS